ncbi:MAG: hypothetical protein MZU97_10450 [Bacillus subtilis]|nr:hypothetical protein [Bacillus subtilis]
MRKLLDFATLVDPDRMGHPSFLAIVSATDYAYVRKDGVAVVPLGCLKP